MESRFGDRLVKQQEFFLIWRLQDRCPRLCFEAGSELVVPHVVTQLGRPVVLVQPDRGDPAGELACECRLARGWKPTDQNEAR